MPDIVDAPFLSANDVTDQVQPEDLMLRAVVGGARVSDQHAKHGSQAIAATW